MAIRSRSCPKKWRLRNAAGKYALVQLFFVAVDRDDLGIYLKVLRSSMIELINEDYADFVNLSTNLVGLDKCILRLEEPLLKHQVSGALMPTLA